MSRSLSTSSNYGYIDIMEVTSLGGYLRDRRAKLGKTQQQIADDAGTSAAYVSQMEGGRVALPNADLRRRLAAALGVSHLDLLVAAGEIAPNEIERAGVQGVTYDDPVRAELVEKLQTVRLTDERTETIEDILDRWIRRDRNASEYVQHSPRQSNEFNIS